jgi:hypothetical protein
VSSKIVKKSNLFLVEQMANKKLQFAQMLLPGDMERIPI